VNAFIIVSKVLKKSSGSCSRLLGVNGVMEDYLGNLQLLLGTRRAWAHLRFPRIDYSILSHMQCIIISDCARA
jgi:hypothetical protein